MEDYMKLSLRNSPDHFILHVGTSDVSSEKCSVEITESTINLACRLKNEIHNASVSTIILRTDDKKMNEKGMELNLHLKELSNNFVNEISKVLHWQIDRGNSNANVEECNFKDDLTAKKYDECNITLEIIRSDNANKLIFIDRGNSNAIV